MTSKFSRFYPLFVEWSALGGFVLLGDLTAQKIEHIYRPVTVSTKVRPDAVGGSGSVGIGGIGGGKIDHLAIHKVAAASELVGVHEGVGVEVAVASEIVKTAPVHCDDCDDDSLVLDYTRLGAAACTGLLFIAPICMVWFPYLHRFMAKYFSKLAEGSVPYVAVKVILENVCLAGPVCLGYFAIPAIVEGRGDWWTLLKSRLENDFTATLTTDVSFWCVASPLNYKFVPVR
jgi:hypothetical protein